jgi:hypothetical protein
MIDRADKYFMLYCDYCGEACEDIFTNFHAAVRYKKDADNGWRTIKNKNNDWGDLCPECNTPEIIRELKGMEDV